MEGRTDTRAKGREKMNLRSKLTRRSYSSRTSFLGYVRGKDYHYVGRIDSFRFSPSSPGVGHIVEEKSTSSMRHRWCHRLYVAYIRTVGAYPTSLEGVAIIIKLAPIVPTFQTHFPPILPSSLPLPLSPLAIVSLGRSRSKSERRKVSTIVSFKCLERACRSILRETDKSNSPRHERACPFDDVTMENAISPPPPVTSRSRQRGDWGQTAEGGRKKKKEERAGENMTGKSATREAANSQKGYFNLMSVNRITFRLSQAAVAATNTCSSLPLSLARTRAHAIADCLVSCPLSATTVPPPLPPPPARRNRNVNTCLAPADLPARIKNTISPAERRKRRTRPPK